MNERQEDEFFEFLQYFEKISVQVYMDASKQLGVNYETVSISAPVNLLKNSVFKMIVKAGNSNITKESMTDFIKKVNKLILETTEIHNVDIKYQERTNYVPDCED
jgi:hypothetical protein